MRTKARLTETTCEFQFGLQKLQASLNSAYSSYHRRASARLTETLRRASARLTELSQASLSSAYRNSQASLSSAYRNNTCEFQFGLQKLPQASLNSAYSGYYRRASARLTEAKIQRQCYTSLGGYLSSLTPQGVCA